MKFTPRDKITPG